MTSPTIGTAPSPEEFLAQPGDPEDDVEPEAAPYDAAMAAAGSAPQAFGTDPLESIAESLRTIAQAQINANPQIDTVLSSVYRDLEQVNAQLERALTEKHALLDEVLKICKPSTSKLANTIRAALETDTVSAPTPVNVGAQPTNQPADDADVEEWREFARGRGYQGPDVDTANRSQIRTMLGLGHPSEVTA